MRRAGWRLGGPLAVLVGLFLDEWCLCVWGYGL